MPSIIPQDASIKSFNALLRDFRPELLLAAKFTSDSGYYTEISRLYATMFHEWSALQKDVSDTMEAVSSLEWTISPYADTGARPTPQAQDAADTVRRAIWHTDVQAPGTYAHNFTELAGSMLDAIYRGASVHEIIWQRTADLVYPAEYRQIAPQHYMWETRTGHEDRLLMVRDGMSYSDPEPFPAHKFIIALNTTGSDHPIYNAVYYSLIGYFLSAKFGLPWLQQYCKRYGHPVMKFSCNTEDDIAKLKQQLKESDDLYSVFLLNEGDMDVTAMPSGASIPHETLLRIAENACHQAILGQTLTSDTSQNGGSRAQAEVHMGVQKSIVMKRAEYVARVLNRQLIPAIIAMNYGSAQNVPMPELKFTLPDDGANIERAEFWGKVLALPGVTVPRETVYESLRLPIPQEGDDTLGSTNDEGRSTKEEEDEPQDEGVKKNASGDDGVRAARREAAGGAGDLLAELTMREYLRPLAAALKEAKERGESYADIKKRLTAPLTNAAALAHGLAAAFNTGRLLPQDESVAAANPYGCNQYGEGWAEPHDGNSTGYQQMGPGKPERKVLTTEHGGNKVEKVTHEKHPGKGAYEHADGDSLDKTAKEEREKREGEKATIGKAKTREEAIEHAKTYLNGKKDVHFDERIPLDMLNAINSRMSQLTEKYPTAYLQSIGSYKDQKDGVLAHASGHIVEVNHNAGHAGIFYPRDVYSDYTPDEKERSGGYARYNTAGLFENEKEGVVTHEYGHVLQFATLYAKDYASQHPAFISGKQAQLEWEGVFRSEKKKGGFIKELSQYAATNNKEFFAECFAFRESGRELPSHIDKALDKIINFAKKRT